MKPKWLILCVAVPLLWCGAGCQTLPRRAVPDELVPFTARHMEDYGEYLKEIQFYISRQIVLHRSIESETSEVTGDVRTIQVEKDMQIQSISFPAKTPGVLSGIGEDTLNVQFEPDPDGSRRTLPFKRKSPIGGDGSPENMYFVFDEAEVIYGGSEYNVYYEEEAVAVTAADDTVYAEKARSEQGQFITRKRFPILLINPVRKISQVKEDNRVVPGMWAEDLPE